MSYCPKCGAKVTEEMSFCPKCGASIKVEQAAPVETRPRRYRRDEKSEKGEKREKGEKGEKGEKREFGFLGPLIGGLILIFLGTTLYLEMTGIYDRRIVWAFFFLLVGIVIIVVALYAALVLTKRHPKP